MKWKFEINYESYHLIAHRRKNGKREIHVWDGTSVLMAGFEYIEELAILASWQLNYE